MNKLSEIPLSKVRVLGIFAHIDAGKTTTSEAVLYYTGRIHRIGSVDDGNTQLDWMEQERARGITITAAATTCEWQGHHINLIDTPGHIDFSAEVVRSVRAIDGAVIVLCGVGGVEIQTETVWRHAERENLPRLLFVNKLDRMGADFHRVLGEIRQRLAKHAVALQIPIGSEDSFHGVIDLLRWRAFLWPQEMNGGSAADPVETTIPAEYAERAAAARAGLLDAICETDERLLSMRLEGDEPDLAQYQAGLRKAVLTGKLIPVLCGSAKNRIGIQPLLDAVIAYLPAPDDGPPVFGVVPGTQGELSERLSRPDSPFCATAFKIVSDPHVGHLTWVRVFSGSLETGEWIYNPRTAAKERVDRIYRIHANRRELVSHMQAGEVMALVGIKNAATGDTLCDPVHPVELEPFSFPEPVITVALAPTTPEERERLRQVMARLCTEDPTLLAGYDPETQEETLSGMGELHLEITVDRMRSEFGITAWYSPPQVAYRETVRARATATGDYRKQSGGHGHYAVVRLRVEPLERGQGVVLDNQASPGEVPENFVRNAQGGIREALAKGIQAGYPVTDVRVTITGGRYHEVDSNALDFQIAGSMAVRQALGEARPCLLEPVMHADIGVSEACLGTVMADFTRRRGEIRDLQVRGEARHILGYVPLYEVRGYVTALRDMTSGRGDFSLEFQRYDIVPDDLAETIIQERLARGKVSRR
jgi:elongation factor G